MGLFLSFQNHLRKQREYSHSFNKHRLFSNFWEKDKNGWWGMKSFNNSLLTSRWYFFVSRLKAILSDFLLVYIPLSKVLREFWKVMQTWYAHRFLSKFFFCCFIALLLIWTQLLTGERELLIISSILEGWCEVCLKIPDGRF